MNEPTPEQSEVRADMRRTLYDDIAAAAIDDIVAGFDLLLMFAAPTDES
jgi:hypothetical protein